jgi:hypothetical protein
MKPKIGGETMIPTYLNTYLSDMKLDSQSEKDLMKLDSQSEKDLLQTSPGYGVIFIKVAEGDVRAIEFFSAEDGTLRTATYLPSADLHEWIDHQHRASQQKIKEEEQ